MQRDISVILGEWDYVPGELSVRKVDATEGGFKIQVRMDLGLMQLEWDGRPDSVAGTPSSRREGAENEVFRHMQ